MTITKKISLGFAIPIVLIIVVGVLAHQVSTRLATTTDWVEHSMEVEVTMQKALTRMVDAETGARGFFITGVEVFLQPYVGAATDVMKLFDRASELTADNSLQRARVEALQRTARGCRHAIAQPAALAQALDPFAAGGAIIAFVHRLRGRPGQQVARQRTVRVVEEGKRQVRRVGG